MRTTAAATTFERLEALVRRHCGIVIDDSKSHVALGILASFAGARQLDSEAYLDFLEGPSGLRELEVLAQRFSVGETYFFRNRPQWSAFERFVVPWWLASRPGPSDRRIKIWSAGCSTGEEAYTAAIILDMLVGDRARERFEIVGTDLNEAALEKARAAVYTENSFRGVDDAIRERYFRPTDSGRFALKSAIRDGVRFDPLNLLGEDTAHFPRDVDIAFCRNVLIYFDAADQERVVRRIHDCLNDFGVLFLGHAERTRLSRDDFATVQIGDAFLYQKLPAASSPATEPGRTAASTPSPALRPSPSLDITPPPAVSAPPVATAVATPDASPEREAAPAASVTPPARRATARAALADLRERAFEEVARGEDHRAEATFRRLLSFDPDDREARFGLALTLAGAGREAEALEQLDQVFASDPNDAEAHLVRGLIHEGRNELDEAAASFRRALSHDARLALAHFRLAVILERSGDFEGAGREYSATLAALDDSPPRHVEVYSGGFGASTLRHHCEGRVRNLERRCDAADLASPAPGLEP